MNYRTIAVLAAILALVISPFLFLLIFIATPRFMWLEEAALFQMLVVILICLLLPLPDWRHKVFAGLIPLFTLVLSPSVTPAAWMAGAFVGLTVIHPILTAIGRPAWNFTVESGLWGLLLTFLCNWVLMGPALMLHLWLRDLWQPDLMLPVFDVLFLFLSVLVGMVSLLVYLRIQSSTHTGAPNKSLNTDAGKAGAG